MIFPPTAPEHIESYPDDDVVSGYRDHCIDDPEPGPNRSPGYRWGWLNARKDATGEADGHEWVRGAFIRKHRLVVPASASLH